MRSSVLTNLGLAIAFIALGVAFFFIGQTLVAIVFEVLGLAFLVNTASHASGRRKETRTR